jgi:hypothetical protein
MNTLRARYDPIIRLGATETVWRCGTSNPTRGVTDLSPEACSTSQVAGSARRPDASARVFSFANDLILSRPPGWDCDPGVLVEVAVVDAGDVVVESGRWQRLIVIEERRHDRVLRRVRAQRVL